MARVLVIDDDPAIRKSLAILLAHDGYEVLTAESGNEGIDIHKKQAVDLIITDIIMPGKNGIETIVQFRCDYPDVKIIAISGGGMLVPEEYLTMAGAVGADKTITKPFEMSDLREAVTNLLEE